MLMILFGGAANAGTVVTYEFAAFSSYPVAGITSFTGHFTFNYTHFITASGWTFIPASSLSECSATVGTCSTMVFSPNAYNKNKWAVIEFGIKNTPDGSDVGIDYYFDLGALSAPGHYDSIVLGPAQTGHLSVTEAVYPDLPPHKPPSCEGCTGGPRNGDVDPYPGCGLGPYSGCRPPTSFLVPEPETYAMLLAGLGLLGFAARRRKQQAG